MLKSIKTLLFLLNSSKYEEYFVKMVGFQILHFKFLILNMSVKVEHLTKVYGVQKAVNDLSFEVKSGEIVGFLGPNGAGKTTTMKIITGYISASEGSATICGFDVKEHPEEVKKRIGYLPENNPLYKEMYVKEYLNFVGSIHKVSKLKSRIADVIELTGLGLEHRKVIGSLSKGYRQRVGLAQAMLHDPEVLILDEPTSGLDPNQLAEIRQLIKNIGKEKTVIFSTHIMQEVQAICDRIMIIDRGVLVADDPIDKLQSRLQGNIIIEVEFNKAVSDANLKNINGVLDVLPITRNKWHLVCNNSEDHREDIFKFAVENQLILLEMHKDASSVEDVFQYLTKEH